MVATFRGGDAVTQAAACALAARDALPSAKIAIATGATATLEALVEQALALADRSRDGIAVNERTSDLLADSFVLRGKRLVGPRAAEHAPEPADARPSELALQPVDPRHFILGAEIARGGMGRIIKARDRRLGREVAIKELLAATRELRLRFEREARITAQLQHPAIINIIEAGTWPTGDPFYVMKLVDGESLDRAIASRKTLARRLELLPNVIAVVKALAYAHDKHVIHRDLKPANVLVGRFGESVVIDWGLAKELGAPVSAGAGRTDFGGLYRAAGDGATIAGSVMGTPCYMPAEQAKGEAVDARADVYALGAMLYHLLAGAPPFTGRTANEILANVIAGPPRRLDEVVDGVPSDLVTVVTTAMAYEAEDRYLTAKQLADELHRFQTGQLVGAHRYTAGERLRRFARRYRVQLTAGAIALTVLAGLAGFSVSRVVDERDVAVAARVEADSQRKVADQHKTRADTERAAAEDLVGFALRDLEPRIDRIGQLPLMKGVATRAGDYYQQATAPDPLDATAVGRRAEALLTLGDVFSATDEDAESKRAYEAAIALLADQPDNAVALARARLGVVVALVDLGDSAAATALVDMGLTTLGSGAASPDVELARAKFERYRGILLLGKGKFPDAIASYDAAIDALDRTIASATGGHDRAYRVELAKQYDRRSDARRAAGDRDGAVDDGKASIAVRTQLLADDPGDLSMQHGLDLSWGELYHIALSDNRIDDAHVAAQEQLANAERLAAIDPADIEWVALVLGAAEAAGDVEYQNDHFDAAYARVEHPLELARQLVERTDSLSIRDTYATLLCHAADYENEADKPETLARAAELGQRCLALAEVLHARAPDNLDYYRNVGIAHEGVGDTHARSNEWQQAVDEYKQRIAVDQELLRRDASNPRRALDLASIEFATGLAVSHVAGHGQEGVALEQRALDRLKALQASGQLPRQMEAALPEYEKQLEAAKQRH